MDYTEPQADSYLPMPRTAAGEWYLRGFMDAYDAHHALAPVGPAGEEYKRGYSDGLEAVQRDFFAAIYN